MCELARKMMLCAQFQAQIPLPLLLMMQLHVPLRKRRTSSLVCIAQGIGSYRVSYIILLTLSIASRNTQRACFSFTIFKAERYSAFLRIHKRYPSKAVKMLPPREIHHVWLCHQLHPLRYKADSIKLIGKILDHANSNFCLDGCPIFHQLWLEETGESWPSRANLRREATKAKEIPEVASNQEDLDYISANLWHNYDGLTRLYFELQGEAPELFASGLDQQVLLLKEARLEYARFLIASSYAATVGMTVTPSGLGK